MKKLFFAFAAILFAGSLILSSCGGGDKANSDQDTAQVVEASETPDFTAGKALYTAKCQVCHQENGMGVEGAFPPLAGSDYLANKELTVKSVLNGLTGKVTVNGKEFNSAMPANVLTDQETADVLNYVFNSWGNAQGIMSVEDIAKYKSVK
jgi:nitrite reductase (NO-forming)